MKLVTKFVSVGVVSTLVVLGAATLGTTTTHAQEKVAPAAKGGVKAEMMTWIKDAEDKLIQLAEAVPEAKYSWRPDKDARSVGEVYMHVATANFGVPSFAGVQPPSGFKFETYEKSLTKKADIQGALKASFAHMQQGLTSFSDAQMDKPVDLSFIGMKTTTRGAYMLLLSHAHEHLGQSIAYARSSGVVPPWTAKRNAAAKDTKPKAKY